MLMSNQPRSRLATSEDAKVLAVLAEQTFRDAFSDVNVGEDMEAYVRDAFSIDGVLDELADGANMFLLVFLGAAEKPIGYAKMRTGSTAAAVEGSAPIELQRLYLDVDAIGQGIGAMLMGECLEHAQSNGHQTVWLGVWENNARALSFYRRWGFEVVGEHVFQLGADSQRDLIMMRPVSSVLTE